MMDKVVIITGAARGLGQKYAIEFAKIGAKIVFADINSCSDTENKIKMCGKEYDLSKLIHETKVTALLRFFHVMEVNPIGWIKLPANRYKLIRKFFLWNLII